MRPRHGSVLASKTEHEPPKEWLEKWCEEHKKLQPVRWPLNSFLSAIWRELMTVECPACGGFQETLTKEETIPCEMCRATGRISRDAAKRRETLEEVGGRWLAEMEEVTAQRTDFVELITVFGSWLAEQIGGE